MVNKLLAASLFIILLFCLQACSSSGLFIVNHLAKLENYQVNDAVQYGPEPENRLTVYRPESVNNERATIIFFYGGCWGGCLTLDRTNYTFVAEALTDQGFNVVIPDYRLYPEVGISEIMDDASRAVEWVYNNIHNYQGDPEQILLMGHSAGAHIAALLTFDERYLSLATYQSIRGLIGLAGPYDFLPLTEDYEKEVFGPESNYANTQPVNFVDGTESPVLLLYGQDDTAVRLKNIKSLTQKIKDSGGQVIAHYYEGIDHRGLIGSLSIPLRSGQPVLTDIIKFATDASTNKLLPAIP